MISLQNWLMLVNDFGRAVSVPLLVGGIALMLFGWRMPRLCVVLAYGVFGMFLTAWLFDLHDGPWWISVAGGCVLALASYWPIKHSVAGLGGLVGGGISMFAFQGLGFTDAALWGIGGLAFCAFSAFSYIHINHVLIGVTSLFGSVFVLTGLAVWTMAVPAFYGYLSSMANESSLVVPFCLVVPMVVSCFYQVGEMHRLMAD